MEDSPETMRPEKRERTRWLRISHVLCLFLGMFVVFALRLYGSAFDQRVRKANVALSQAYLPALPLSTNSLVFLHEDLFFADRYIISFRANIDDIHSWISGFSRAPGFDDTVVSKTGVVKYELAKFTWGGKDCGRMMIDEKRTQVDVDFTLSNWSL